jgi:hypothetical protein
VYKYSISILLGATKLFCAAFDLSTIDFSRLTIFNRTFQKPIGCTMEGILVLSNHALQKPIGANQS